MNQKCIDMADNIADRLQISPALYQAFCEVDREIFVEISSNAFNLQPQIIAANQWVSSPLTVAKMTMLLELEGVDKILEIGCGVGYQAAILSKIVRRVFTIERIERLANQAKNNFKKSQISNINIRFDDGLNGWKSFAPFDRILFSACAKEIPNNLFNDLAENGILVTPMQKKDKQIIVKFRKSGGKISQEIIEECEFVPILNGIEKL